MQAAERGPQHDGRREGEQHQAGQRHPYVRERGRRSHEPLGRRHEDKNPEEDPEHGEEDGIEADGGPAAALRGKRDGAAEAPSGYGHDSCGRACRTVFPEPLPYCIVAGRRRRNLLSLFVPQADPPQQEREARRAERDGAGEAQHTEDLPAES